MGTFNSDSDESKEVTNEHPRIKLGVGVQQYVRATVATAACDGIACWNIQTGGTRMDIAPDKQNIDRVFSNITYHIDFYQRDYKWTSEPVLRLVDDIFYAFDEAYEENADLDPGPEIIVAKYPWYYLNSYVTNSIDGRVYVVDGHQRLTTLTLVLIKLHHMEWEATRLM